MKSLDETVEQMSSPDYKDRFRAEYMQTKIRYEKLKNFCNRIECADIMNKKQPEHDCPLYLLREQQHYMGQYLGVLEKRAIIEEIELPEI